jgi:hypothetical protein
MSISAISNTNVSYYQTTNAQNDPRRAFAQLASAIQSGNLDNAQQAYSTLTDTQASSGQTIDPNSPLGQALSQIGQDLQSGDINGAQQVLSNLQSARGGGHHHHHHGGGSNPVGSTDTSGSGLAQTPSTSGNNVDLSA